REETGLEIPDRIEPIGFFARPGRDPRGRTITLAHAAVIRAGEHRIEGGDDAAEANWLEVKEPIDLAFDHEEILETAKEWLIRGVRANDLGLAILPRSFAAADVHTLFDGLDLPRRQARGWLERMRRAGRIEFIEGL